MLGINVVGGIIKGLKLESNKNENLRPTKDRIKESLFDILSFSIENKVFLDLFGGTGQIGIEAFSRGAEKVIIVENNKDNVQLIKRNISKIKMTHSIELLKIGAIEFLKSSELRFDIAFIDPPYQNLELLEKSLEAVSQKMNPNGIIVTETSSQNIQNSVYNFSLQKTYKYGSILLCLYKNRNLNFT